MLQTDGITDDSLQAAIEAAHKVCEYLDQGKTIDQVVYDVVFSSHLPAYDSGYMVGAERSILLPEHAPHPDGILDQAGIRDRQHVESRQRLARRTAIDHKTFSQRNRHSRRRHWVSSTCWR